MTAVPGIVWPPLRRGPGAILAVLLQQLEETQWLSPGELRARQLGELVPLTAHAAANARAFRDRLAAAGLSVSDLAKPGGLQALPPMSRQDVRAAGEDLFCAALPPGHGETNTVQTSGATGEPVVVRRTGVTNLYWMALTLRDHLWHGRDFKGTLAVIRPSVPERGVFPDWGQPANLLFETGPMHTMPLGTDIGMQGPWLAQVDPHYLLTFPANLAALLDRLAAERRTLPNLRAIRSLGETLTPALRGRVREQLGVPVTDSYSSQELGILAVECPASGLYHVMAENVIVEILRDDGAPSAPGENGRVVVTDLHNYATPLVRYDIGDRAEAGSPCPCGRGLSTLARILGRSRNMLRLPNGERRWPLVGFYEYQQVAPIRQYQLVQTSLSRIEVRLVVTPQLNADQEARMRALITRWLGAPFELDFRYYTDAIPRGPGGKFEDFICLVPDGKAHGDV